MFASTVEMKPVTVSPIPGSYLAIVSTTSGNKSESYRKPTENLSPASAYLIIGSDIAAVIDNC